MLIKPNSLQHLKHALNEMGRYRVVLVVTLLCILLIQLGRYMSDDSRLEQQKTIEQQAKRIEFLQEENNLLVKQLNFLNVELEVEKMANQQAQMDLKDSGNEQVNLKRELSFYQKVMAPELSSAGLAIEALNVTPTSTKNDFRFELILVQLEKRREFAKGKVRLQFEGFLDGKARTIELTDLAQKSFNGNFSFRYFERLEGEFTLPQGFTPVRLEVEAKVTSGKLVNQTASRQFDWSQLAEEEIVSYLSNS